MTVRCETPFIPPSLKKKGCSAFSYAETGEGSLSLEDAPNEAAEARTAQDEAARDSQFFEVRARRIRVTSPGDLQFVSALRVLRRLLRIAKLMTWL